MDKPFDDNSFGYALPTALQRKVYTPKMLRVAAFVGGPLAGAYLLAQNFKAFDEPVKEKMTWVYTVLFCIVLIGIAMFIPAAPNRPVYIVPLLYSWAGYSLMQYLQGRDIDKHLSAGGELYGWGRVILIGLIGLVTLVVAAVIILSVLNMFNPNILPDN